MINSIKSFIHDQNSIINNEKTFQLQDFLVILKQKVASILTSQPIYPITKFIIKICLITITKFPQFIFYDKPFRYTLVTLPYTIAEYGDVGRTSPNEKLLNKKNSCDYAIAYVVNLNFFVVFYISILYVKLVTYN